MSKITPQQMRELADLDALDYRFRTNDATAKTCNTCQGDERMSEQQYRVVADRDTLRDFLMNDPDVMKHMPDSVIERVLSRARRIERPVPTTDERSLGFWSTHVENPVTGEITNEDGSPYRPAPSLPTREQIAETLYLRRFKHPAWDRLGGEQERWLKDADALLALLQKGDER